MHNTDSLGAGSLCNAFHFTDFDIDALQRINRAINFVQSGIGSILLAVADSMFAAKLNLPTAETSLCCIRHLEAILQAILPPGHPSVIFISEHYKVTKAYEQKFFVLPMVDGPITVPLHAVYHLHWLFLHLHAFFCAQEISETFVLFTSDPRDIITKAELQERWEPYLSEVFISYNGVYDLITRERKIAAAVGTASLLTSFTHGKTEVAMPVGNLSSPTLSAQQKKDMDNKPTCMNIPTFDTSLFGEYKTSAIKSKTLCDKIKEQEIWALPTSKIDGSPMCLAYHTKGQCNTKCL
jgi:hypothetical protein